MTRPDPPYVEEIPIYVDDKIDWGKTETFLYCKNQVPRFNKPKIGNKRTSNL